METYTLLREFADSWFLIAMFTFFFCASVFAFLPSLRSARADAASIPLRDDVVGCGNARVSGTNKDTFNSERNDG